VARKVKTCKTCHVPVEGHPKALCPFCRHPANHHNAEARAVCQEGKARMARARQRAGIPLTPTDLKALA